MLTVYMQNRETKMQIRRFLLSFPSIGSTGISITLFWGLIPEAARESPTCVDIKTSLVGTRPPSSFTSSFWGPSSGLFLIELLLSIVTGTKASFSFYSCCYTWWEIMRGLATIEIPNVLWQPSPPASLALSMSFQFSFTDSTLNLVIALSWARDMWLIEFALTLLDMLLLWLILKSAFIMV